MAIPIALEAFTWIVPPLCPQELDHPRMTCFDLGATGPAVIGKEIAATEFHRAVDQAPEIIGRLRDTIRHVSDVQVHDRAGPGLSRPSENALLVAFDEADGAVDPFDARPTESRTYRRQERGQGRPRYIELANHVAALVQAAQPVVKLGVIAVDVDAELT